MAQRYFVDRLPPPGPYTLPEDLAHHVGTVLRARPGMVLRLADGRGGSAEATVLQAERRVVTVAVAGHRHASRQSRTVHVAFALPKGARAEWLFEHGTEVGVAVFQPIWTRRSRPAAERADRWRKQVLAAAGQCDRDWLPEVREPVDLAVLLADATLPRQRLLAAPGAPAVHSVVDRDGDALLLVGPEGGFDDQEVAAAMAAGFTPVGLGPHVLRTETAAVVGAALLVAR